MPSDEAPHLDQSAAATIAGWFGSGARWVVLDGLGAAGKTSLARAVQQLVTGLAVVQLDDFTRPGSVGWETGRFGDQVHRPLEAGQPARYQRWHWTAPEPGEWVEIDAGSPVLFEGINAADPATGVDWDHRVWVDCPAELRDQRARLRDPARHACWSTTWEPIQTAWAERTQPWLAADLVVSSGVRGGADGTVVILDR